MTLFLLFLALLIRCDIATGKIAMWCAILRLLACLHIFRLAWLARLGWRICTCSTALAIALHIIAALSYTRYVQLVVTYPDTL